MANGYSTYKAASEVAPFIADHFNKLHETAILRNETDLAPSPSSVVIEATIDAAFWASLRKEEGRSTKISLAYFSPDNNSQSIFFENKLPLTAEVLTKLAPGFERPGVHIGIWEEKGDIFIWGASHKIPNYCFILDVPEPGLLVIKHKRLNEYGKFSNVAVLKGDEIKMVEERSALLPGCPTILSSLLGFEKNTGNGSINVMVQLAVSMRAHSRGGTLIIVPSENQLWKESIRRPVKYAVQPSFSGLANLLKENIHAGNESAWQAELKREVDIIAGLTAIDGAIILNDKFELLIFGAKLTRLHGSELIEKMMTSEPVIGGERLTVLPVQSGGTRHLSAAQFVHDQKDAMALVASQDSRFTVFTWSDCDLMVQAHRIESLLL